MERPSIPDRISSGGPEEIKNRFRPWEAAGQGFHRRRAQRRNDPGHSISYMAAAQVFVSQIVQFIPHYGFQYTTPGSVFLKPEERTDPTLPLELHLETAAGHDPRVAAPARFVIQIDTIHVEAGTELLYLPFLAGQLIIKCLDQIHKNPAQENPRPIRHHFRTIPSRHETRKHEVERMKAR